jgi:hypothetical protein
MTLLVALYREPPSLESEVCIYYSRHSHECKDPNEALPNSYNTESKHI